MYFFVFRFNKQKKFFSIPNVQNIEKKVGEKFKNF